MLTQISKLKIAVNKNLFQKPNALNFTLISKSFKPIIKLLPRFPAHLRHQSPSLTKAKRLLNLLMIFMNETYVQITSTVTSNQIYIYAALSVTRHLTFCVFYIMFD